MKKYGLIGNPLGHSWSQRWFEDMFRREGVAVAQYCLYELPTVAHLPLFCRREGLNGFNVTIPYKEAVLPLLDEVDATARSVGAVNCVSVRHGRLVGHNTDAPAFAATLQPLLRPWHTHALVLGTGGAAKAVLFALRQLGIEATSVSRFPEGHPSAIGYAEALRRVADTPLLVNCTPVGMHPHTDASPWPAPLRLTPRHLCYDLIYNPTKTRLLREAELGGAAICNGLPMLERQAELSWAVWNAL